MRASRFGTALLVLLAATTATAQVSFVDRTSDAGLAWPYLPPADTLEIHEMSAGMSVVDFNDDGWEDIFWFGGWLQPNRLYRNNGDGTFTDVAASAGLAIMMPGANAMWGDYDNDGDLDVFMLTYLDWSYMGQPTTTQNLLFRNNGDETFTDFTPLVLKDSGRTAAAWGDIDGDGWQDLVTCSWGASQDFPTYFFKKAQTQNPNFTDITPPAAEFDANFGFAPTIIDFDRDGDNDVWLIGDFMTSRVFRNDGGGNWTNISNVVVDGGPLDDDNGMGSAVGDWNGDGWPDWFVSSTYVPPEELPQGWNPKTGNRMYTNDQAGGFTDMTDATGTRVGGWGWGAMFGDWDNDADLDLAHANGFYVDNANLEPILEFDTLRMFENDGGADGGATFTDRSANYGVVDTDQGRGLVLFDYDQDGRLDMLISNNDVGLTLYRNESTGLGNWVAVELRSNLTLNTRGLGARVKMSGAGLPDQYRWMLAKCNYASQPPLSVWFGAGAATTVDFEVEWEGGLVTQHLGVPVNQRVVLTDDDSAFTDLGLGLAGTGGLTPMLAGVGTLAPLSSNSLDLTDALPNSTMYLVLGLSQLAAPFKGGTLVPAPLIPPIALPTTPAGALSLPFTWPSGVPAGVDLFFQYWVVDPAGPKGFAASNGLQGTSS